MRGLGADVAGRTDHLGHFVNGATQEQPGAHGVQLQPASIDRQWVEEHRQGAEQHHATNRHGAFVWGTAQGRFEGQNRGGAADGAAGRGQQGGIAVQLEQLHAAPQADQQGAGHHQQRHDEPGPADFGNFLQAYPQAEEGHGNAQQAAGGKVDTRRPASRYAVTQRIAVKRTGDDTDDQRADTQVGDGGQGGQLGDRKREQRDEQDAIEPPSGREGRCKGGVGRSRGHVSPPERCFDMAYVNLVISL
ncbi:hypothetical protein D3C81_365710 [compost metagenome]